MDPVIIYIIVGIVGLVVGIVLGKLIFDKGPVREQVKFEDCFDITGKGIGKYEGWQIINGNRPETTKSSSISTF